MALRSAGGRKKPTRAPAAVERLGLLLSDTERLAAVVAKLMRRERARRNGGRRRPT